MEFLCKNINHKRDICICSYSVKDCINCPSSYHQCVCSLYHNVWIPICKHLFSLNFNSSSLNFLKTFGLEVAFQVTQSSK